MDSSAHSDCETVMSGLPSDWGLPKLTICNLPSDWDCQGTGTTCPSMGLKNSLPFPQDFWRPINACLSHNGHMACSTGRPSKETSPGRNRVLVCLAAELRYVSKHTVRIQCLKATRLQSLTGQVLQNPKYLNVNNSPNSHHFLADTIK